jgi:hypothetical protein
MIPAATASAGGPTREACLSQGSVRLYADAAHSILVDRFDFTGAPTQQFRHDENPFMDDSVVDVEVVGILTGNPYLFEFHSLSRTVRRNGGGRSARTEWADWRVTHEGSGLISDTRNQLVKVSVDGELIVDKSFGPIYHGLFLSGGIFTPSATCTPL